MKRLAVFFGLLALLAIPAVAQENPSPGTQAPESQAPEAQTPGTPSGQKPAKHIERYTPKYEMSGGYTHRSFYFPGEATLGMNGWYGSFDYNWFQWLGAYFEGSGVYKNRGLPGDSSIYTFGAGPRVYPLRHRRLTPFGQVLVGEAYYRNVIPSVGGFTGPIQTIRAFMWQGGGGLDYFVLKHWGIRVIEFDYAKPKLFGNAIDHGTTRVSFGVVYRFGER